MADMNLPTIEGWTVFEGTPVGNDETGPIPTFGARRREGDRVIELNAASAEELVVAVRDTERELATQRFSAEVARIKAETTGLEQTQQLTAAHDQLEAAHAAVDNAA